MTTTPLEASVRYAKCIEASRRVRWDIERDVIRGRRFDPDKAFLPENLSRVGELAFLTATERRRLSQVQGCTYAGLFGLIEHGVAVTTRQLSQRRSPLDRLATQALACCIDEGLKHQALFRRLAQMAATSLPAGHAGHALVSDAGALARLVPAHSPWAALALMFGFEILALAHYRASLEAAPVDDRDGPAALDPLWKEVFLAHWKEAAQHAILGELEWRAEHARLDTAQRERGVHDLVSLVAALDGLLVPQAAADTALFLHGAGRGFTPAERAAVHDGVLRAYRWQYIVSGAQEPRFVEVVKELLTLPQRQHLGAALAPIVDHVAG